MTAESVPGSFRDPSGFLYTRDGVLLRQVNTVFAGHYDALMASGLYERLVAEGILIPHEEVDAALAAAPGAHRVLRPELIGFVSHPYEWSFSQLRDAALLTLRAQKLALEHGMTLRDASAYNVQFHRGKPVLIDTLSFGTLPEGEPWIAYRQFCQHFLAPLALMSYRDVRLGQLSRIHIDGVPLDLASRLLPRRTRFRLGLLLNLHLHARAQRRHADAGTKRPQRKMSPQAQRGVIASLEGAVRKLKWRKLDTVWRRYYEQEHNYTDEALEHKKTLVAKFVEELRPRLVWDLGGNTGLFSRVCARTGAPAVCFDFDAAAVEANYRRVRAEGETGVLPLVLDLTNPSGGIGWENRERGSLADRGPADLALALALVHHLAISNNVPLPMVARFFRGVCERLVIEWVPKSDSQVQRLLATREDIFDDYTQDGFERAFATVFEIERREPVHGSERTLYLMKGTRTG